MKNIFDKQVTDELIARIDQLAPATERKWGKMDAAQMLAHCSVTYEMVYTDKHKKPNAFVRGLLKMMVKKGVCNEKPYKKNIRTAPQFIIADKKEFEAEKKRLIGFMNKSQTDGEAYFDGKESLSFGKLSKQEWNNMFYKHLDHHLTQFGV